MLTQKPEPVDDQATVDAAKRVYTALPNHVASDAAFRAAVAEGDADIAAGRTVPFAEAAARLRGKYRQA